MSLLSNKKKHEQSFICIKCNKLLDGDYFKFKSHKYCVTCWMKRFQDNFKEDKIM